MIKVQGACNKNKQTVLKENGTQSFILVVIKIAVNVKRKAIGKYIP